MSTESLFPKSRPALKPEQIAINDDWQKLFFEINKSKYSSVVQFGHKYVYHHSPPFSRTLEIGPGLGEHLYYENLTDEQMKNYVGIELRENMAAELRKAFPKINVCVADCQEKIHYPDGYFDRIIAIHVLEHLINLPFFLKEAQRLLQPKGRLLVVLPCEGGFGYWLGRQFTTKRMFEKRYKQAYEPYIKYEHVNTINEILDEIKKVFLITHRTLWPLNILPSIHFNLVMGLVLAAKEK